MKNFNRRMVTMAQSALNWHNIHTRVDRGSHALTHTITSTQLQPLCVKRQLSYYRIWNQIIILNVPERGVYNEMCMYIFYLVL